MNLGVYIRLTHLVERLCIRHTYALSNCFYSITYKTIVDQAPTDACYPQVSIRKRLGQ